MNENIAKGVDKDGDRGYAFGRQGNPITFIVDGVIKTKVVANTSFPFL